MFDCKALLKKHLRDKNKKNLSFLSLEDWKTLHDYYFLFFLISQIQLTRHWNVGAASYPLPGFPPPPYLLSYTLAKLNIRAKTSGYCIFFRRIAVCKNACEPRPSDVGNFFLQIP